MVMSSWRGRVVAVAAAAVISVGAVFAGSTGQTPLAPTPTSTPTPPPEEQTYNQAVFDGANGSTCDTTPTRLTTPVVAASVPLSATACSFNQAWQQSNNTDNVLVKNDTYNDQAFLTKTMTSPGVVFWAEGNVNITGDLKFGDNVNGFGGSNQTVDFITFRAVDENDRYAANAEISFGHAEDITMCDVVNNRQFADRVKAVFWRGDTNRTKICRSDLCCVDNDKLMESFVGNTETLVNQNITIEDTNLHSLRRTDDQVHNECWFVSAVPGLMMDRVHLWGCTSGVNFNMSQLGDFGNTVNNYNWTIQNSIIEAPTDVTETDKLLGFITFAGCNKPNPGNKTGWLVQNNIFEGTWYFDDDFGCGDSGLVFRNNIMRTAGNRCPGGTVTYNLFDRTCAGTGNINGGATATVFGSTNFPSYNSSLVNNNWAYSASAQMINTGDPSNCPAVDINGTPRPSGGRCDIGPEEKG